MSKVRALVVRNERVYLNSFSNHFASSNFEQLTRRITHKRYATRKHQLDKRLNQLVDAHIGRKRDYACVAISYVAGRRRPESYNEQLAWKISPRSYPMMPHAGVYHDESDSRQFLKYESDEKRSKWK